MFFDFVGMFWGLMVCWYMYIPNIFAVVLHVDIRKSIKLYLCIHHIYIYISYITFIIYIMRRPTVVFLSDLFSIFIGTA